jgi:hypothetical protein
MCYVRADCIKEQVVWCNLRYFSCVVLWQRVDDMPTAGWAEAAIGVSLDIRVQQVQCSGTQASRLVCCCIYYQRHHSGCAVVSTLHVACMHWR